MWITRRKTTKKINILFPIGSFYPSRQSGPGNAVFRTISKLPNEFSCTVVTSNFECDDTNIRQIQSSLRENLKIYYLNGSIVHFKVFSWPSCKKTDCLVCQRQSWWIFADFWVSFKKIFFCRCFEHTFIQECGISYYITQWRKSSHEISRRTNANNSDSELLWLR